MTASSRPVHGGRLAQAARRWQRPETQWLDLSTGINPVSWPVPEIPQRLWHRLPEEDDGLEPMLRRWTGAPDSAACVPVPGSQAAIQTLPRLRAPGRVGVPVPGYQEHGHCWAASGHQVVPISEAEVMAGDAWLETLDALVWINPNNPTGCRLGRTRLEGWLRRMQARGGLLVVDEAFLAPGDGDSLADLAGQPGLVVLKSLGKFFGLAGVRAGAVITDEPTGDALRHALGPWAVSGPARHVMMLALADTRWQRDTEQRLAADAQRLAQLLARHGLPDSEGTLLFRYARHPAAGQLAEALAQQGVLVRYLSAPEALRFGLPGIEADWQKLSRALHAVAAVIDQ